MALMPAIFVELILSRLCRKSVIVCIVARRASSIGKHPVKLSITHI